MKGEKRREEENMREERKEEKRRGEALAPDILAFLAVPERGGLGCQSTSPQLHQHMCAAVSSSLRPRHARISGTPREGKPRLPTCFTSCVQLSSAALAPDILACAALLERGPMLPTCVTSIAPARVCGRQQQPSPQKSSRLWLAYRGEA